MQSKLTYSLFILLMSFCLLSGCAIDEDTHMAGELIDNATNKSQPDWFNSWICASYQTDTMSASAVGRSHIRSENPDTNISGMRIEIASPKGDISASYWYKNTIYINNNREERALVYVPNKTTYLLKRKVIEVRLPESVSYNQISIALGPKKRPGYLLLKECLLPLIQSPFTN